MTLLLHGSVCADQYLVDVGELVPVSAVNARSAWTMAMTARYGAAQQPCPPEPARVYQLDSQGELIAVVD
jgi:hypothetical protein